MNFCVISSILRSYLNEITKEDTELTLRLKFFFKEIFSFGNNFKLTENLKEL